ncbi:pyruvate dehydrogenase E1 component alpha subunit [Oceanotoga teriensis]|uniref:Pyruvate dehydrogenase E1 component subunit alpha n=1 Tax=Oceanotoga teriensis TaxID=515440 RepID=A0AA45C6L2_9BACT|nr:pyruvate dehydrogenase (acetyl-transferring) E1 component subunit alpha [Oceanotoga teriensis]PWJ92161.1 pyruvate dehydrogenase E1 component alpha subunit [Oceanotoga teriensis]
MIDIKKYDKELLMDMLEKMVLIRRFEEKAAQSYGLRKIGGFLHLYIGEEAVAVGAIQNLNLSKDYVLTTYRDHGHALACGLTPNSLMAELYGKITGCSKGKGGSMHFFDEKKHFYGGNGIVGAHIPIAAGVGLKIKYLKEDGVVLCFFGDGAIHQGSFHETLNMTKIWEIPVIFICENNQYGMGTDFKRVSSIQDFSIMAGSYGMYGEQVNGMNILEVYDTVKKSIEKAKNGIPVLLEAKTYRYKGHSASDPAKYRSKDELEKYKSQDPILILKNEMIKNNLLKEEEFEDIDIKCKKIAKEAADYAEKSDEPDLNELYTDILI